jgi:hypothetical protein
VKQKTFEYKAFARVTHENDTPALLILNRSVCFFLMQVTLYAAAGSA